MPLPNIPNPQPWPQRPSGRVFAADMNAQLRDAVRFLSNPPMFYGVQAAAAQSIPGGSTPTDVQLDAVPVDNFNGQNNLTKYTFQRDGVYLAIGGVTYTSGSTNNFLAQFDVNGVINSRGSVVPSGSGFVTVAPIAVDLISGVAGTTVALNASQATGGAVTLANATAHQPYMYLQWIANRPGVGTPHLAVPNPRTWSLNDLCTDFPANAAGQGSFNVEIYNAISFLSYVPVCRVASGAVNQTGIANATDTQLTGLLTGGINFDPWGSYNTVTDTWTAPVSGLYFIAGQSSWNNGSAASYVTSVRANLSGTNFTYLLAATAGQGNTVLCGHIVLRMTAGDTLQLFGRQTSGGALATTSVANDRRLVTAWMGA